MEVQHSREQSLENKKQIRKRKKIKKQKSENSESFDNSVELSLWHDNSHDRESRVSTASSKESISSSFELVSSPKSPSCPTGKGELESISAEAKPSPPVISSPRAVYSFLQKSRNEWISRKENQRQKREINVEADQFSPVTSPSPQFTLHSAVKNQISNEEQQRQTAEQPSPVSFPSPQFQRAEQSSPVTSPSPQFQRAEQSSPVTCPSPQLTPYSLAKKRISIEEKERLKMGRSISFALRKKRLLNLFSNRRIGYLRDNYRTSDVLNNFKIGNIILLINRLSKRPMRVTDLDQIDCKGDPKNRYDEQQQFLVISFGWNIVSLKSMTFPLVRDKFLCVRKDGRLHSDGAEAEDESRFRLHETDGKFVTFESYVESEHYIAFTAEGDLLPPNEMPESKESTHFSARVLRRKGWGK